MKFRITKRTTRIFIFIVILIFTFILAGQNRTKWINPETRNDSTTQLIPKIIHQTWKTSEIPQKWKLASSSCREKYPGFEFILWNDTMSEEFIKQKYSWFYSTFTSYYYPIQKADAIRYFVLHEFGGIYMDLDIGCSGVSLEPLLNYPLIIPKTKPIGYSNDLLMSIPKHPFMSRLIRQLSNWNHWYVTPYLTVFFSTGPMFLNIQFFLAGENVYVLSPLLYSEGSLKMFTHHQGSSWHSWDAALVKFLFAKKIWILISLCILLTRFRYGKNSAFSPLPL
jgi:inositol phosphorylceramide mannosyltransferase catalytic subunit